MRPRAVIRGTPDAYFGLDDASPEAWARWHAAMLDERARVLRAEGLEPDMLAPSWSDATSRQFFLFMHDARFWDPDARLYRTAALCDELARAFGRVDSVLLWHAYPRIGFDRRTQFDFYRDMPGGLARLRAEVVDVFHARGVRVFVDYNPWATGTEAELAEIVDALDADGIMLDTLTDASEALARAVAAKKSDVVLAPELRPRDADLVRLRQSWAQWSDVGDGRLPAIPRASWLVRRHRQLTIRRWDTSRRDDIAYSFASGQGLLLWDNVFGTWNPYGPDDRKRIAETAAVIDRYGSLFTEGVWHPLVPTGVSGLDASTWSTPTGSLTTLRNRTDRPLAFTLTHDAGTFWDRGMRAAGERVVVAPHGVEAVVVDAPRALSDAFAHFDELSARAAAHLASYEVRTPRPRPVRRAPSTSIGPMPTDFVALPGGAFTMTIRHERRECGCLPDGATDDAMWGWFYRDPIVHVRDVVLAPFAMRRTALSNAAFLAFVHAARYRPLDDERFLLHLRDVSGALPAALPEALGALPVTFVSLADARAFATFYGERLPSEAEWQWAAEGCGAGLRYPWGDEPRACSNRSAEDATTATPQGVLGLSGNVWELTDTEHDDGHTRFVMLRGGVWLEPDASEWVVPRGARPNDFHAKYILLSDGYDRSETVGFRTVRDRSL